MCYAVNKGWTCCYEHTLAPRAWQKPICFAILSKLASPWYFASTSSKHQTDVLSLPPLSFSYLHSNRNRNQIQTNQTTPSKILQHTPSTYGQTRRTNTTTPKRGTSLAAPTNLYTPILEERKLQSSGGSYCAPADIWRWCSRDIGM